MDLDDWSALVDFWRDQDRDLRHLGVPAGVAKQLNLPMEIVMTEEHNTPEEGTAPSGQMPNDPQGNPGAPAPKAFKKKRYFPEDKCGFVKCSRAADGYVVGTKPTGKDKSILWYGPACTKCVRTWHDTMVPLTLAELAYQRNGVSDLALILDVEVGEVKRRLEAAGVDENGVKIIDFTRATEQPTPSPDEVAQAAAEQTEVVTPQESMALTVASVTIPTDRLTALEADVDQRYALAFPYEVADQAGMNWAGEQLRYIKGVIKDLDAERLGAGKQLRERLQEIQDYYNPVLGKLASLEGLLKAKIKDGNDRMAAQNAMALAAAQQAYATGDQAALASATQAAVQADVSLPQGVSARTIKQWRIVDASQVPFEMYTIDPAKIQAAVDAGYQIPGVEIYEESTLAARAQ